MNDQIQTTIKQARDAFWQKKFDLAADQYTRVLDMKPEMWWLKIERIRAIRHGLLGNNLSNSRRYIKCYFSPNYQGNSYQKILYFSKDHPHFNIIDIGVDGINLLFDKIIESPNHAIFHQHWLKEIYSNKPNNKKSVDEIKDYFHQLKRFRSVGGKVVWTIHNIFDHDLDEDDRLLNRICLEGMSECSDLILVHSQNTVTELETAIDKKIDKRVEILRHPLYDSMYKMGNFTPPEITNLNIDDQIKFLFFGMIRPYKGALDLVRHFLEQTDNGGLENSVLILAGKIYDEDLKSFLIENSKNLSGKVIVIDRWISDGELKHLCHYSDVAVMPYKKILISGSYYQATTFALPSIVPNIGMFETEVIDGATGIKYSKPEDLGAALVRAYRLGRIKLRSFGSQALAACRCQTESVFSSYFYNLILSLFEARNGSN